MGGSLRRRECLASESTFATRSSFRLTESCCCRLSAIASLLHCHSTFVLDSDLI